MGKRKIIFYACLSFVFGVFLVSFFNVLSIKPFIYFLFCALLCLGIFILKGKKRILLIFIFCLFLGLWRFVISIPAIDENHVSFYNGKELEFEAYVYSEPDLRMSNQKLEVLPFNYRGQVLVTLPLYPEYGYGDILKIKCKLKKPEPFEGFAYDRYLAKSGIHSLCYYPEISSKGSREDIKTKIIKNFISLKHSLRDSININLPEPEAGLAQAMLLGYKQGIDGDLREKMSRSGLSHVSAISGLHIGIVIVILFWVLVRVGFYRKQAFYIASVLLFLFIVMIGFPASAVRAGIMGFMVLLAMHLGRLNKLGHSLMIVATLLLLINPRFLRDDIGFQLSFLAVLGIVLVYPRLKKIFFRLFYFSYEEGESKKGVKNIMLEILLVSISAQFFTAPIILFNFGAFSFVSPLSNLLILWILPILIISLIVASVLALIFPFIGGILFFPSYIILLYIVKVAEYLSFGAIAI